MNLLGQVSVKDSTEPNTVTHAGSREVTRGHGADAWYRRDLRESPQQSRARTLAWPCMRSVCPWQPFWKPLTGVDLDAVTEPQTGLTASSRHCAGSTCAPVNEKPRTQRGFNYVNETDRTRHCIGICWEVCPNGCFGENQYNFRLSEHIAPKNVFPNISHTDLGIQWLSQNLTREKITRCKIGT